MNARSKAKYLKNTINSSWYFSKYIYKKLGIVITEEEYHNLYESQEGKCAICSKPQSDFTCKLALDHDHITKKVRGFLCKDCNIGIGLFKENSELFISAMSYLKKHTV